MTGTPVSKPTLIKPLQVDSEMYSKCIVEPLIKTPMAMIASKGEVNEEEEVGVEDEGVMESRRDVADMRSAA